MWTVQFRSILFQTFFQNNFKKYWFFCERDFLEMNTFKDFIKDSDLISHPLYTKHIYMRG